MNRFSVCGGCVTASPVFCGDIQELTERFSDSRQRFDPGLIAGCVRCRFGRVQVLVCRPFTEKLRPFPTTFWLTCPYLIRRAGMIESQGGVGELEEFISSRGLVHQWRSYNVIHQVMRLQLMNKHSCGFVRRFRTHLFRSVMRSGIGGMKLTERVTVKCLHLQTASFIALGRHPGSEWLREKGLCGECPECSC